DRARRGGALTGGAKGLDQLLHVRLGERVTPFGAVHSDVRERPAVVDDYVFVGHICLHLRRYHEFRRAAESGHQSRTTDAMRSPLGPRATRPLFVVSHPGSLRGGNASRMTPRYATAGGPPAVPGKRWLDTVACLFRRLRVPGASDFHLTVQEGSSYSLQHSLGAGRR